MHKSLIVAGTDNVIDFKRYRAFKEAKKLFTGYKNRVFQMKEHERAEERIKVKEEFEKYPNHMLTQIKVQIFENVTNTKV